MGPGLNQSPIGRLGRLLTFPLSCLLDLLYPPNCPLCGELLDLPEDAICPACRFAFDPVGAPRCARCGQPTPDEAPGADTCPECARTPPRLDPIRSGFLYGGPLREAIHLLKFEGRRELAPALAGALLNALPADWDWAGIDLLVPVPLHRRRLIERGFNPAQALARRLATATGIPSDPKSLIRVRATPAQARCPTREARQANVAGAFAPGPGRDPAGLRICLIDDVVTSGATLDACAGALLAAGALSVCALTLARTPMG